jgi:hypothetical protein
MKYLVGIYMHVRDKNTHIQKDSNHQNFPVYSKFPYEKLKH